MPLDPLQNLLDCCAVILHARRQMKEESRESTRVLAQIGELDHLGEIRAEMGRVFDIPERIA